MSFECSQINKTSRITFIPLTLWKVINFVKISLQNQLFYILLHFTLHLLLPPSWCFLLFPDYQLYLKYLTWVWLLPSKAIVSWNVDCKIFSLKIKSKMTIKNVCALVLLEKKTTAAEKNACSEGCCWFGLQLLEKLHDLIASAGHV